MRKKTWIKRIRNTALIEPVAIVGSPGLRSIGSLVIDRLIDKIKPELMTEIYSTHFPLIYQTVPSYASDPSLPGIGGVKIDSGRVDFPKIRFYSNINPPLIITRGSHANFEGQYEVAEKVLDVYEENRVKRMIVVAGHGMEGSEVCCAANSQKGIQEMREEFNIEIGYVGPFYGFSGIVFGLAKLRGIEALCLFGRTKPKPDDPELPDVESSQNILDKLFQILRIK